MILMIAAVGASAPLPACPTAFTRVDAFVAEGLAWSACEDLATPGGHIVLAPSRGAAVWLPKTCESFAQGPDSDYYLGLDKQSVLAAKWDVLGQTILTECGERRHGRLCEPTWRRVERARGASGCLARSLYLTN